MALIAVQVAHLSKCKNGVWSGIFQVQGVQDTPEYPKEYPKIKGFFQMETGKSVC